MFTLNLTINDVKLSYQPDDNEQRICVISPEQHATLVKNAMFVSPEDDCYIVAEQNDKFYVLIFAVTEARDAFMLLIAEEYASCTRAIFECNAYLLCDTGEVTIEQTLEAECFHTDDMRIFAF